MTHVIEPKKETTEVLITKNSDVLQVSLYNYKSLVSVNM